MEEQIFREKSLERIKSPEELNDYVRVASPGVWLLLAAVIVILIGACIWGIFGAVESSVTVSGMAENNMAYVELDGEESLVVKEGMVVRTSEIEGVVVSSDPASGTAVLSIEVPDGVYAFDIITESVQPFSFVFN